MHPRILTHSVLHLQAGSSESSSKDILDCEKLDYRKVLCSARALRVMRTILGSHLYAKSMHRFTLPVLVRPEQAHRG